MRFEDVNIIGESVDGHGQDRACVPYPCEECGEVWAREERSKGARYLIGGRWLCVACRCK